MQYNKKENEEKTYNEYTSECNTYSYTVRKWTIAIA